MTRQGVVGDASVTLTKGITLYGDSDQIEIAYLLEGLPTDRRVPFAVEFNFSSLPAGADDRFFYLGGDRNHRLGQLGSRLDLCETQGVGLVDEWLGVDVSLEFDQATDLWTLPVESVSQSEGGFELVHQSTAVLPHWNIQADPTGRWSTVIRLRSDCSAALARAAASQACDAEAAAS